MKKLTQAEFIGRARGVHGDKYDYSQAIYCIGSEKVKIVCPAHGLFEQIANSHLQGQECALCGQAKALAARKRSTESFIEEAQAIHGMTYDYSKVAYKQDRQKVKIICSIHGSFEQTPNAHIQGQGCKECGRARTAKSHCYSTAMFIERAQAVHGKRYDYGQVNYISSKSTVLIGCSTHGLFTQGASFHLAGQGCAKCGILQAKTKISHSTEEFIARAREVHGDKFDYSQSVYTTRYNKIKIICSVHGLFEQAAKVHIKSEYGCPKCGYAQSGVNQRRTTESFIEQARQLHNDRYDYSETSYSKSTEKIRIICLQHGSFWQVAATHLNGHGCPECRTVRLRQLVALDWVERAGGKVCTLYFLRIFSSKESFYKIGITYRELQERYRDTKELAGYHYEVLALHKSTNAAAVYDWEQSILETFAHFRYRPKRSFGGETECFSEANPILAIFPL